MDKNPKSLAELYEEEFKNVLNLPGQNNQQQKIKIEIDNLFKEVCYKLDALSNFNFIPKPIVKSNLYKLTPKRLKSMCKRQR